MTSTICYLQTYLMFSADKDFHFYNDLIPFEKSTVSQILFNFQFLMQWKLRCFSQNWDNANQRDEFKKTIEILKITGNYAFLLSECLVQWNFIHILWSAFRFVKATLIDDSRIFFVYYDYEAHKTLCGPSDINLIFRVREVNWFQRKFTSIALFYDILNTNKTDEQKWILTVLVFV